MYCPYKDISINIKYNWKKKQNQVCNVFLVILDFVLFKAGKYNLIRSQSISAIFLKICMYFFRYNIISKIPTCFSGYFYNGRIFTYLKFIFDIIYCLNICNFLHLYGTNRILYLRVWMNAVFSCCVYFWMKNIQIIITFVIYSILAILNI